MNNSPFIEISTIIDSFDYSLFKRIIEKNSFPNSKFEISANRFIFNFHRDDVPFLLEKLKEQGQEEYIIWAADIRLIYEEKLKN